MLKFLIIATILLIQSAWANDFLRSDKQVLYCHSGETFFRINWEDFEVKEKKFMVRQKLTLLTLRVSIDRESSNSDYIIKREIENYNKDGSRQSGSYSVHKIEDITGLKSIRYIDRNISDSEARRVCAEFYSKGNGG